MKPKNGLNESTKTNSEKYRRPFAGKDCQYMTRGNQVKR